MYNSRQTHTQKITAFSWKIMLEHLWKIIVYAIAPILSYHWKLNDMLRKVNQSGQGAQKRSRKLQSFSERKKTKIFWMSSLLFVIPPVNTNRSYTPHVLVASEESGNWRHQLEVCKPQQFMSYSNLNYYDCVSSVCACHYVATTTVKLYNACRRKFVRSTKDER